MNKNRPLVSIVLNNYNYAEYLGAAIDSALAQTHANCEVVVVDDGSKDGSRALIEKYGSRIRAILKENGGQASAFNVGIEAAEGVYILLLDSDDALEPYAVEKALALIDPSAVRLLFGLKIIDREGQLTGTYQSGEKIEFIGTLGESILKSVGALATPTSGNFFLASALKASMPIPEQDFRICADAYIFIKIGEFGPVQKVTDCLARYRVHGSNHFFHESGRFGLEDASLTRLVENLIKVWAMIGNYLQEHEPERMVEVTNASLKLSSLELVSDAKVRELEIGGLKGWTSKRLIAQAYSCMLQQKVGLRGGVRSVYGFVTIVLNELLPVSAGRKMHQFLLYLQSVRSRES